MDEYVLINQIGEGSFGKVYKARRKYTGRLVAIKIINKHGQTQDDLTSFRREIDLLQKVSHPNIMKMFGMFETETEFCVVSELGRGDLFQIIDDNQTLPEDVLRSIAAQLVSSLKYIHSLQIIHRDMKPQNVLIGEKGALKICDFGFARSLEASNQFLTSVKGTPLYMAPELVQGQQYDEKVDVWALGVILYELYFGQPPFFSNSIYKLMQMIVNNPILWPSDISGPFRSFLDQMLQRDPRERKTAEELMKHEFIAGVALEHFDDRIYQFKKQQFDGAIRKSLVGSHRHFKPKKSKGPDYQAMFLSPDSYSDDELVSAVKYLRERNVDPESPLAASFAFHFPSFLQRRQIIEDALLAATDLLKKDYEKFSPQLSVGIRVLEDREMPQAAIGFLTELVTIPFVRCLLNNDEFQLSEIQLDEAKSEGLRDRLLSFLFSSDSLLVERTYALMSLLAQKVPIMVKVMAESFAIQLVPMLTSAICATSSQLVRTSAFSLLALIVERNPDAMKCVLPLDKFLKSFDEVTTCNIETIEDLCVFSAAMSFVAVRLDILVQIPQFQQMYSVRESLSNLNDFLMSRFFKNTNSDSLKELEGLLWVGSLEPTTEQQLLCYGSVLSSIFSHLPMHNEFVGLCVQSIMNLLPMHQVALLDTIFCLDMEFLIPSLPLLVPLYSVPACADCMSGYILDVVRTNRKVVEELCEAGILHAICTLISTIGPSVPANAILLLVEIVLSFDKPTSLLEEQARELLNALFSVDSTAESALVIASHFARMSKAFTNMLMETGSLDFAQRVLASEIGQIKTKALNFIGNLARHGILSKEHIHALIPDLIACLDPSDQLSSKHAAYALGNLLFWLPEAAEEVIPSLAVLVNMLNTTDIKTIEHVCGVFGNIVRTSDTHISALIENGCLDGIIQSLKVTEYPIFHLASFCQYTEARKHLMSLDIGELISPMLKSSREDIQKLADEILKILTKE